jgi:CheY-like chemotaxis protein
MRFFDMAQNLQNRRTLQKDLLSHFVSIGIEASAQSWMAKKFHSREGDEKVTSLQLAGLDVQMKEIHSIEVWRQIRKQRNVSLTHDEIRYIIVLKPGITMRRIPILSTTVISKSEDAKSFQWSGFSWGKLPLLVERLKADENLNKRLQYHFNKNILSEIRIRAMYEDKVDIISDFNLHNPPSRDLLNCIEDIAYHVVSYVVEENKSRDHREEMTRIKLFGND